MPVAPVVFGSPEELGAATASLVLERLASHPAGRPFLLGCPGGRSLRTSYAALARQAAARRADLRRLVVVMMDEYLVPDREGRLRVVDPGAAHSCHRFGAEEVVGQVNAALTAAGAPAAAQVPPENLWLPDPDRPGNYDDRIAGAGGITVFLLASGSGDGHVAFNSPGADRASRTRVVALPESTRRDNLATFPSFGGRLEAVPRAGVTVGIATIAELSAEAVLVAAGTDKQQAVRRLTRAGDYEPDWPATVLAACRRPVLFVDRSALGPAPA